MNQLGEGSSSPDAPSQPKELYSEPAFSWLGRVKQFRTWRLEPKFLSGLMLSVLWPWAGSLHFVFPGLSLYIWLWG